MRMALGVSYDGAHYHGWQAQVGLSTIQEAVERALSKVANEKIQVVCAGRTDTGVHATAQVIHFDTKAKREPRAWILGSNSNLPKEIAIHWAERVGEDFHARHSAVKRRYRYVIYNSKVRPSLFNQTVTWQYRPLDHHKMHQAAQLLVGEHDFTSFRSVQCQAKSPTRTVHELTVMRQGELIIIDITANAFLHHMVRNIAGVLMAVGTGKQDVDWVNTVLSQKDRSVGAETAPPYGLYLIDVHYPEQFALPHSPLGPVFLSYLDPIGETA